MKPSEKRLLIGCLGTALVVIAVAGVLIWRWLQPILIGIDLTYEVGFLPIRYASDNDGLYAPLSSEPGKLMYEIHDYLPDYVPHHKVFIHRQHRFPIPKNLSDEERAKLIIDDHSWFYLGYLITSDTEARAFEAAYRQRIADGGDFTTDLTVPEGTGNFGTSKIYRLRSDLDEFLSSEGIDIPEHLHDLRAPIIIQRPGRSNTDDTLWVFILPGLSTKVPLGTFPASSELLDVLESLDKLSPATPRR